MMILTYSTMLILVVIFVVSIAWPAGGRPEAGQGEEDHCCHDNTPTQVECGC